MKNKKKHMLVTGVDGFIGSYIFEMLHAAGRHARAFAKYNSLNHWGWLEDVDCQKDIEIISGDFRDSFFVMKSFAKDDLIEI